MRADVFGGLALALLLGCASSPPSPSPPPSSTPAPAPDANLTQLTEWLKLDSQQQQATRRLLELFYARNAAIRQRVEKGARLRPEEFAISRGTFEQDFAAILTDEQRRIYANTKLRLIMKGLLPNVGS